MNAVTNTPTPEQTRGVDRFLVGVEVGPSIIRAGVFDLNHQLLGKTKITTRKERGPADVIERIVKCIRYAVDECDLSISQILKVGVAVPGQISTQGVVESCPELNWESVPLQASLAAQLGMTVETGQVYELGSFGIQHHEFDKPIHRFAAIFLGPQIGGAVSIDGRWQSLDVLDPDLGVGNELNRNILASLPHPEFDQYRGRDFRKALRKEANAAVRNYITQIADAAGVCAARMCQHFSPEIIVLGGGLIDEMKEEILAVIQASCMRTIGGPNDPLPTMVPSRLGDMAPITGAALWAGSRDHQEVLTVAGSGR